MEKIIDIVRDNIAKFDWACGKNIYYKIIGKYHTYLFPIDMSEKAQHHSHQNIKLSHL